MIDADGVGCTVAVGGSVGVFEALGEAVRDSVPEGVSVGGIESDVDCVTEKVGATLLEGDSCRVTDV